MKKPYLTLLISVLLLIPICARAQDTALVKFPMDTANHMVVYECVVEVKNSSDQLYKDAQGWVTEQFSDYKKAVQLEDKANGRLVIKGNTNDIVTRSTLSYTIMIDVKDDKYRYTIKDIYYTEMTVLNGGTIFTQTIEDAIKMRNKWKPKSGVHKSLTTQLNYYNISINRLIESLNTSMKVNDSF